MNVKINLLLEVILRAIVDVFGGYKPDDEKADEILQKIKVRGRAGVHSWIHL